MDNDGSHWLQRSGSIVVVSSAGQMQPDLCETQQCIMSRQWRELFTYAATVLLTLGMQRLEGEGMGWME